MNLWDEPLSEEQKRRLIENIAVKTVKSGMSVPAIIFLEMHKPIANIACHGVVAFSPFIAPLFGTKNVDEYTQLLADCKNVEQLIQRIETLREEQEAEAKEQPHAC